MGNPYLIDRPACISFSGGRTSGYMLWHIIQAFGGTLPDDVHVVFANTGKERLETIDFIHECETRWNLNVRWLEYVEDGGRRWREVDYDTASREGEPFEALIRRKKYLPNAITRLCTTGLKIEPIQRFMGEHLALKHWTTAVGIRHDEPRRWRILGEDARNTREFKIAPLKDSGVTEDDVLRWWGQQEFDLRLRTYEGNCDLCFLKGRAKKALIAQENPGLVEWWARMEEQTGALFRKDQDSYAQMQGQGFLFRADDDGADDGVSCFCTD